MSSRVNSMLPLPLYGDVRNIDGQIAFLPSRYLVSYGKDSTLRFWKWWEDRRSPGANPRFVRQENAFVVDMPEISDADGCNCKGECKCRVVCSDFSPGGSFFATGNTDASLHIYEMCASGTNTVPPAFSQIADRENWVPRWVPRPRHARLLVSSRVGGKLFLVYADVPNSDYI